MKKSVVLALAAALACGAASTAFAANPFSDVPADHWAYDAVAQLAEDGIIEGYGDGSYRGQQEITRYEMAQMIARALAKNNSTAAQAQLDKLAAEFSQELNSLGVRVAALEKKTDNVRWFGELRYTSRRNIKEGRSGDETTDVGQLRIHADAKVNKNWLAKAGYYYTFSEMHDSPNGSFSELHYLYAQGKYGNTTIDLGSYENVEPVTEGMLWDQVFTGARVTTGKDLKLSVSAARVNAKDYFGAADNSRPADLFGATLEYAKKGFGLGAGYYAFNNSRSIEGFCGDNKANIWAVSAQYRFNKDWRLYGTYAKNSKAEGAFTSNNSDVAYNIELDYKKAQLSKPGTYRVRLAYTHTGPAVVTSQSTYDYNPTDAKGMVLTFDYVIEKNLRLDLGFFKGETISDKKDFTRLHSRVHWFF